ncbi:MAG: ATP-binding protein, partial [Pseudomonadota bacterium]|nr:ATP-binding protein [Pseudomonadota bacterium]
LASGIAHDFNNVLQSVVGGIALIELRLGEGDAARRYTRLILDAAERGAAVTGRLLAFARHQELEAAPVDPGNLLAGLGEMLAPTLGASIALRVESEPKMPALLADKGQLETVLVNLVANARDAMPGGGTLTLVAAVEPVASEHPAGLTPGSYVRLSVGDTGVGIDRQLLARVTEPFFTTKPSGEGTGLGLAMAKNFAEQSGGALAIESERGRGTVVSLWLPRAPPAPLQRRH